MLSKVFCLILDTRQLASWHPMGCTFRDSEFCARSKGCAEKRSGWTRRTIARTDFLSFSFMSRCQNLTARRHPRLLACLPVT